MRILRRSSLLLATFASLALVAAAAAAPLDGTDGGTASTDTSADVSGTDGQTGGAGSPGGDGGNAGSATVTTGSDTTGDLTVGANGGDGGSGSPTDLSGDSRQGGDGGDAGTATVTINNTVTGSVIVNADGGDGGHGQTQEPPPPPADSGKGGTVTITVNSTVGGDVVASADGGIPGAIDIAPSQVDGYTGPMSGTEGTAGTINVVLNPGAVVDGQISVTRTNRFSPADATLTFNLDVHSKSDYAAAKAYLGDAANTMSGTITVDGHSYNWTGFDHLVDSLNLLNIPNVTVTVTGARNSHVGGGGSAAPHYFACKPRGLVIAYADATGVVFNAKQPGHPTFFRVGQLIGPAFASANPLGWTVSPDQAGKKPVAQILDQAGTLVATCKL